MNPLAMGNVQLHAASGFSTASIELARKPVVVGRSGDLRLEDDTIEKKHARFTLREGKLFVAPMGRAAVLLRKQTPLPGETEIAPGDVVLLSTFAAVFVAETVQQEPSRQAREALEALLAYQRDRVLVRLLELPAPRLVQLAFGSVREIPPLRLQAVAPLLRSVLDRLARQSGGLAPEQLAELEAQLSADRPLPTGLAAREASERRFAAARRAPPPLDEEGDPEASAGSGTPTRAWHLVPADTDVGHGFSHGAPPIEPSRWPRSPRDGVPMTHVATLLVPAEYRAAGPEKVAIAIFQADDHVRARVEGAPRHEGDAMLLEDAIGGSYALVWLDAAAFARGPGGLAPEGVHPGAPQFLRLRARTGDPNIGKVIPDWDDEAGEYVAPDSEEGEAMMLSRFSFPNSRILAHFGGTSFACDNFARGLGPVYLALEHRFGGANFGGGNAVIDLARRRVRFGS